MGWMGRDGDVVDVYICSICPWNGTLRVIAGSILYVCSRYWNIEKEKKIHEV